MSENFNVCCYRSTEPSNSYRKIIVESVDFREELAKWSCQHQITNFAINDLLRLLKNHHCFASFPTDSRTLKMTKSNVTLKQMEPEIYHHFGLKYDLIQTLERSGLFETNKNLEICLSVGVGGVPVSNSTASEFHPITVAIDSVVMTSLNGNRF